MSGRAGIVLAGLLAAAAPAFAGTGGPELASYRAVYDLGEDDTSDARSDASVSGRMVVEFTATPCGTYQNKMRFVTNGEDADGNTQVTDSRTDSVEENGRFQFTNETYVNDELAEDAVGTAQRTPDGITVNLSKPAAKTVTISSKAMFPTEQLKAVLDAARSGQHFLSMDVFDGSQTGDLVYATASVIGETSSAGDDTGDEPLVRDAGFAGLPHWPIVVSYFEKKTGSTDDTPAYVTSFVGYDNGIGRKLRIDYGKFALAGQLTHLELLKPPACNGP